MTAPCSHLDFVVIGAMKAGTTSVFEFLGAHPGVHAPRNKEPHYFTRGYRLPAAYYRSLFRGRRPGQLNGEASPTYSWVRRYPQTPARLAADAPGVRLVYLVRDPIERLLSHHRHHVLLGQVEGGDLESLDDPDLWDRGRYRETLEAFLRHFPRDRIFVADIDDLGRDDRGLRALLDFLGLDAPSGPLSLPVANASADRAAVPGFVGRVARTPVGSVLRDLVPRERLSGLKRTVARPIPPPAEEEAVLDAAAVRRRFPERCAEVEAEYRWIRETSLDC